MIYVITEYKTKYRTSYEVQSECLLYYNGRDECVCAGSVTNGMDDSILMRLRLLLHSVCRALFSTHSFKLKLCSAIVIQENTMTMIVTFFLDVVHSSLPQLG